MNEMKDSIGNEIASNLGEITPKKISLIFSQSLTRKIVSNLVNQGWLNDRVISGDPQQDVDRITKKVAYLIQPTCERIIVEVMEQLQDSVIKALDKYR